MTLLSESLRRLCLPTLSRATVAQAAEAQGCTGCTAEWYRSVRFVHARPDCPVHAEGGCGMTHYPNIVISQDGSWKATVLIEEVPE